MGCQISCGEFDINTSRASWMVAQMCEKWFDKDRDTDGDGHHQDSVDNSAIKAADAEWPRDVRGVYNKFLMEHFTVYKNYRAQVPADKFEWFEQDFKKDLMEAREFIANVAKTDGSAMLSH